VKDQELNPRPHTPRPAALPVKVEQEEVPCIFHALLLSSTHLPLLVVPHKNPFVSKYVHTRPSHTVSARHICHVYQLRSEQFVGLRSPPGFGIKVHMPDFMPGLCQVYARFPARPKIATSMTPAFGVTAISPSTSCGPFRAVNPHRSQLPAYHNLTELTEGPQFVGLSTYRT